MSFIISAGTGSATLPESRGGFRRACPKGPGQAGAARHRAAAGGGRWGLAWGDKPRGWGGGWEPCRALLCRAREEEGGVASWRRAAAAAVAGGVFWRKSPKGWGRAWARGPDGVPEKKGSVDRKLATRGGAAPAEWRTIPRSRSRIRSRRWAILYYTSTLPVSVPVLGRHRGGGRSRVVLDPL